MAENNITVKLLLIYKCCASLFSALNLKHHVFRKYLFSALNSKDTSIRKLDYSCDRFDLFQRLLAFLVSILIKIRFNLVDL